LLTHLSDGLAARHDIPASVQVDLVGSLPPAVHVGLYRIAQEAMNNVAKHANTSSLTVTLIGTGDRVDLTVVDDGYGFDESAPSASGMGLDIMRERAHEIGATLTISSELDVGTTVDVNWEARMMSEST
jgi:signal transduction histidine kinase